MRVRPKITEIEWSKKSMVHNVCRVLEIVFGRTHGVRAENSTAVMKDEHGKEKIFREFYTLEAMLVYFESELYKFLLSPIKRIHELSKIKVYVPAFSNGYQPIQPFGYIFAVAEDNTTANRIGSLGSSPQTFSHTTAGSNRLIAVSLHWSVNPNTITSTYNGVSTTAQGNVSCASATRHTAVGTLVAPATGANNVVVTYGSATDEIAHATTFTGVDQTTPVEANGTIGTPTNTTYPKTITITTLTDQAMVVAFGTDRENGITGADGTATDIVWWRYDTYGTPYVITGGIIKEIVATAGSKTLGWTGSGNNSMAIVAIVLKPVGSVDQALTVTAQASAVVNNPFTLLRALAVTAQASATLARAMEKTITVTAQATSVVARTLNKILTATGEATTSMVKQNVTLKTLVATAQATTSLAKESINVVMLAVTASASATVDTLKALERTLTATASATASLVQSGLIISRELLVTARATVTQASGLTLTRVLTVTASPVVSLLRDFGFLDKYPENEATYEDKYPET